MKSTVKKLNDSKVEVTCEVDEKVWQDAQTKARKKAYSEVTVKGFRKGHVPDDIAKKHVNEGEIFNEAINIVLPDAFASSMQENKITPFTRPQVNVDKFSTSNLTLRFTVVLPPEVKLGNYKGLKIAKGEVKVDDKEVDESIKKLLENNATLVTKNSEAKLGDTVILDFKGFVDDKPFDGGEATNYELSLGSGQFIPGFEDQLVGLKANDEKDVNVTFPENYVENLKGKKALFKCKIHEVKEKKIPELNDASVKELNIKYVNTIADLKKHQKEEIVKRKTSEVESKYYNDLLDAIAKDSSTTIDEEIIKEEINAMKENMMKQVEQNGLKWDQYLQITGKKEEEVLAQMKIDAERNIKMMLVVHEISKKENITVSDEDVNKEYKRIADLYKMDVKKVEEILSKDLDGLKSQIRSNKLHDLLISLNK